MTTEEFEGHLMAVLHGPSAQAVANRVVTLIVETAGDDIRKAIDTRIVGELGNIHEMAMTTALLSIALATKPNASGPDRVKSAIALAEHKRVLADMLREEFGSIVVGSAWTKTDADIFELLGIKIEGKEGL